MKKKKILIHSIVFSPDGVSTAYLYNDIALKFKADGFEVVVLTTTPHYNILEVVLKKQPLRKRLGGVYYESYFQGILVKHVLQKKFKKSLFRILGFLYWHFLSFFIALFERNVSVILSPSPPLTIGFINIVLAKLKGCKVIYNVQEIYPDFLIEQGGLKSKPIISILKWLERFVYNQSDAIITIDKVFYDTIARRIEDKSKLHVIANFVDTELYKPLSFNAINIDRKLFPENSNKLKVMYAGNIGLAQDWEPLIRTAIELKDDPIEFFIIGEGVMKNHIINEVEKYQLKNVSILPYQPRELMPSLIAYSDLQFIFMSKDMEGQGFPSKVYTIMACSKPLVVCSGEVTPIYNFLKDLNCAYLITEGEIGEKTNKVVSILRSATTEILNEKGRNGLDIVQENYSKDAVTKKYIKLANDLLKK